MNSPDSTGKVDPLDGTPYRSTKSIGSGAMGDVIEAEHRGLGKRVVVKLVRTEVVAEVPAAEDRFRLESQALASLDRHPNIVQVFDCGRTPSGRPYLVMEHLGGRTLREEMALRGPFKAADAVRLADQVLRGLEAVHSAGLVHRDIKPSNLFLCDADREGECVLKILDFGIVKLLAPTNSRRGPAPLALPTTEGVALGTPQYLAPEQALGQPVDCRADFYSVGAVLYWMLVGKHPFHGCGGAETIMFAHVNVAPNPPSTLAMHSIPRALDDAILKALSKKPGDRFASAAQFRAELEKALAPRPQRWASTEPLDTAGIRAAAPSLLLRRTGTEPLDTSAIRAAAPGWRGYPPQGAALVARESDAITIPRPASVPRGGAPNAEPRPGAMREQALGAPASSPLAVPVAAGHGKAHRRRFVGVVAVAALLILGGLAALVHVMLADRAAGIVG